jgi:hypothetical protein
VEHLIPHPQARTERGGGGAGSLEIASIDRASLEIGWIPSPGWLSVRSKSS